MDVRDVIEREVTTPPQPPQAPEQKSSSNFERKRWTSKRTVKNSLSSTKDKGNNSLKSTLSRQTPLSEKEEIHLENVQKLYTMSSEQIEKEREELFRTMDPNILAGLLRRMEKAEIDIGIGPQRGTTVDGFEGSRENRDEKLEQDFLLVGDQQDKCATKEGREEEEEKEEKEEKKEKKEKEEKEEKDQKQKIETGNQTATNTDNAVDPSSPDFFTNLHKKYFANLDIEPEKMAWMKPVTEEEENEYNPNLDSLTPSQLRFDFKGNLISPTKSANIPSNIGLHHHGDAPGAAGYSILELSHLARSTNQGQRCLAIQTLGRIGFKVGKLQYGEEISEAVKELLIKSRVLQTLYEGNGENVSVGIRAYSTEALWLFNEGGLLEIEPITEE